MSANEILSFWLGELDAFGFASKDSSARWWKKDAGFDAEIRDAFLDEHTKAMSGELDSWRTDPRSRLALVILLDQFSRNMFRDTPGMFASDGLALELTKEGVSQKDDKRLQGHERVIFFLPYMHSEELADQDECIRLFTDFSLELSGEARQRVENNVSFAEQHKVIIERFGRFPHRNKILGRESSAEETTFLQEPGSSF